MMIWIAAAAALAISLASPSSNPRLPAAATETAGGEFVDRAGVHHSWQINKAHALFWDGKAYVPAGVVLHVPAAEATGQTDPASSGASRLPLPISAALDLLAAHGVKDVCVARAGGWLAGARSAYRIAFWLGATPTP